MASTSLGGRIPVLSTMRLIAAKCWPCSLKAANNRSSSSSSYLFSHRSRFCHVGSCFKTVRLTCPQQQTPHARPYIIGQTDTNSGKKTKDIDPEARRQAIERRAAHRALLDDIARAAAQAYLSCKTRYADLIVNARIIVEAKSIAQKDAVDRVRGAIAQLFHYKFLHRADYPHAGNRGSFSRVNRWSAMLNDLTGVHARSWVVACWQNSSKDLTLVVRAHPLWLISFTPPAETATRLSSLSLSRAKYPLLSHLHAPSILTPP